MRTLQEVLSILAKMEEYALVVEEEYYHPDEFYAEIHSRYGEERLQLPCKFTEGHISYGKDYEMHTPLAWGVWLNEKGFAPRF